MTVIKEYSIATGTWIPIVSGVQGATGATGAGVPIGGTTNQILSKINSTDYNTQWVSDGVPIGIVNPFAGASEPSGWLLCHGQAISRSVYSLLFAVIGTTYGVGDGSTTFNIPDMRGRAVAGKDDMGGTAASRLTSTVLTASNTLGATGGAQTHTLTAAQSGVPAHGHGASSNTTGSHSHGYVQPYNTSGASAAGGYGFIFYDRAAVTDAAGSHSHTITVSNNSAADASSAHTNTQPTIILNYIIKALQ